MAKPDATIAAALAKAFKSLRGLITFCFLQALVISFTNKSSILSLSGLSFKTLNSSCSSKNFLISSESNSFPWKFSIALAFKVSKASTVFNFSQEVSYSLIALLALIIYSWSSFTGAMRALSSLISFSLLLNFPSKALIFA